MAPRCGCGSSSVCGCRVTAGTNVTVTGTGSAANPYVINASGGSSCYAPTMTRAAALTLRASAGLVIGCPVLISDGPTIGVAGFTSPTTILIWPVSPTEFGLAAQINTTFDNSGWEGLYDIDGGSLGAGAIIELRDNLLNEVYDRTGDTIAASFPWGFSNVTGNRIGDPVPSGNVSLSGWGLAAAANAQISGNKISNSDLDLGSTTHVDLTGLTSGVGNIFFGNVITDRARFRVMATATLPATFEFTNNTISDGFHLVFAPVATPGIITVDGSTFAGRDLTNASNNLEFTASSTALSMARSSFRGGYPVGVQFAIDGAGGTITMIDALFGSLTTVTRDAASTSDVIMIDSDMRGVGSSHAWAGGVGSISYYASRILNGVIARDPGATGALALQGATIDGASVSQGPVSGDLTVTSSSLNGSASIQQNTSGSITIDTCVMLGGQVENNAGATRGLRIFECDMSNPFVSQQRTADSGVDLIQDTGIKDFSSVTLTGAGGDVGAQNRITSSTLSGQSAVNFTDPSGAVSQTTVEAGATLNVTNGGSIAACRFAAGSTYNTGAFATIYTIVEGNFTKTATAANTNRLKNKSFDDII